MKHRGRIQPLDVRPRQPEAQSEIDRYPRDQKAMLIGSLVVTANRFQPVRQPVLGEAVRNPAAAPFVPATSMGLPVRTAENIDAMSSRARRRSFANARQNLVRVGLRTGPIGQLRQQLA